MFLIFGAVKGFDSLYVIVKVLSKVLTLCLCIYVLYLFLSKVLTLVFNYVGVLFLW